MFIADLAKERPMAPEGKKWVRIGSLWAACGQKARVKFSGLTIGPFAGRLKPGKEPVYVSGDLFVTIGQLAPGKNDEQWIGHIQSTDGDKGIVYWGDIEIIPCKMGEPLWAVVRE